MILHSDLMHFGLNEQEQRVYLLLAERGWSTVIQLSKNCQIKRTTLYRILETLKEKGHVMTRIGDKTTYYSVASTDSFLGTLRESEETVRSMQTSLRRIREWETTRIPVATDETSVVCYKGIRGLKQMEWIIRGRKPNTEVLVFDSLKWSTIVGEAFAEELRGVNVERKVRIRSISNAEDPIAKDGTTTWTKNTMYTTKYYRHRIISRKVIDITEDLFLMPDSIVYWGVKEGDEVAIEVKNSAYTSMMRQLFEFMWDKAKVIDGFGERFK